MTETILNNENYTRKQRSTYPAMLLDANMSRVIVSQSIKPKPRSIKQFSKTQRRIYNISSLTFPPIATVELHSTKSKHPSATNTENLMYQFASIWSNKSSFDARIHQQLFDKLYELIKHSEVDFEDLNQFTSRIADYLIHLLIEFKAKPTKMAKSLEGSLVFEFRRTSYFASVEIFNDEDIVFLEKTEKGVWAQDIVFEQLRDTMTRILKRFT